MSRTIIKNIIGDKAKILINTAMIISWINTNLFSDRSLRIDAKFLHNLNIYIIRSCFWVIFLIGIIDISIAFLRVEKIFDLFLTKDITAQFTRPVFVGSYIHIPLIIFGFTFEVWKFFNNLP